MTWWYSNKATQQKMTKPVAVPPPKTEKKPRATNAETLFAKSCEADLRAATSSQLESEGDETPGHNLSIYGEVKKNTYIELSAVEKEKWERLAVEHNEKIKLPPSSEHIYKYTICLFLIQLSDNR